MGPTSGAEDSETSSRRDLNTVLEALNWPCSPMDREHGQALLFRLSGSGLFGCGPAEQAATDEQARKGEHEVQKVVPVNPGRDGEQTPVAQESQHGEQQQYAGERDVQPLVAGGCQRECSQQPHQPSEDVHGVVEAVRLEEPENVMIRHLGVVGEPSLDKSNDSQHDRHDTDKQGVLLVSRPRSRIPVSNPKFFFWRQSRHFSPLPFDTAVPGAHRAGGTHPT